MKEIIVQLTGGNKIKLKADSFDRIEMEHSVFYKIKTSNKEEIAHFEASKIDGIFFTANLVE